MDENTPATYYTREVTPPKNMAEGLQNFVQLIINRLEAGDTREGLLMAVDLLNDLRGSAYAQVTAPDLRKASIPMDEHLRALADARAEATQKGIKAGEASVRAEIRNLLGQPA